MSVAIHDAYLETQVTTATPQRLRLMLIEEALRQARAVQTAWRASQQSEGAAGVVRCREIVSELIGGIQPDQTPVAKRVLGIYLFLFSALVEAQLTCDLNQLAGVIRVLEEELETWREVCRQLPERMAPAAPAVAREELAPQRVVMPHADFNVSPAASSFSIDA